MPIRWTALLILLAIALPGCDSTKSPAPENSTGTNSPNAESETNSGQTPLPPAPVPNKRIYADSFINKPAPDFVVEAWLNKEPDRQGKMVLIDFWATWCTSCIASIPKLNGFHEKYRDRLAVIGISQESAETIRDSRSNRPRMNYALAIDPEARMYNALGITHIPNIFLIDPTGVVRWQGNPLEPGHQLTEDVIEDLLNTYVP